MKSNFIAQLQFELQPKRLMPTLTAGGVSGILAIVLSVSFASLIFSGELAPHIGLGLGMLLISAVLLNVIVAPLSSLPLTVATPQDSVAAILALMTASVMSRLGSSPQTLPTVVAAILATTFLMGVFFFLLGRFRLGRWVRFIPYPVVGGFLAGKGWLLAVGAIGVMTSITPNLNQLLTLVQPATLLRWLPGVIFALILFVATRRFKHAFLMPALLFVGIIVFYVALFANGVSIDQARAQGWLIGSLPSGVLWSPFPIGDVSLVNWSVVAEQYASLLAVLVVSVISLLLNATSLEIAARADVDLDQELVAAGVGNLIAGLAGGMAGFHGLNLSTLGYRVGARSKLAGIVAAIVCAAALIFGAAILTFIPKMIVGGMLFYLGFGFLFEWTVEAREKLPRGDYLLVLMILFVVATVGFIQGVSLGVVIAAILFVVNYSRINVVRNTLSGISYRSNVDRSPRKQEMLAQRGEQIFILKLQGFLFFGTVNVLLDRVRERLKDRSRLLPRFLVLDFRLVDGVDSSAVLSFVKLRQIAEENRLYMIFSGVQSNIRAQLKLADYIDDPEGTVHFFETLDEGADWCERRTLTMLDMASTIPTPLDVRLSELLPLDIPIPKLMNYLEKMEVNAGEYLIRQGAKSDEFYIVESGEVTILLERDGGSPLRIRTMGAGTVVGEAGFYTNSPRTTSVVAERATSLYRLTKSSLDKMHANDPQLAVALHQFVIRLLAERLGNMNRTVQALLE